MEVDPPPPPALFLSRVHLRSDAPARALAPVLLPADPAARMGVGHRLMWTLFPNDGGERRDFLWREEGDGRLLPGRTSFLILSRRPPVDSLGLFTLDPPKPFTPALSRGDRLAFSLRANPVVTHRPVPAGGHGKRHDVVMDRLYALPKADRASRRDTAMVEAAHDWLAAQGDRGGFRIAGGADVVVERYHTCRIPRDNGRKAVAVSVLDVAGRIEVTDPDRFLQALSAGFGKAKAFGCGLMLIRRVREEE